MLRATNSDKVCRFCKEGKDIEGKWAYGRNWLGANRCLEEYVGGVVGGCEEGMWV